MNLQVGQTMKMNFVILGLSSVEELEIMEINEETIGLYKKRNKVWLFDKQTGECLNDDKSMGGRRSIAPIRISR